MLQVKGENKMWLIKQRLQIHFAGVDAEMETKEALPHCN